MQEYQKANEGDKCAKDHPHNTVAKHVCQVRNAGWLMYRTAAGELSADREPRLCNNDKQYDQDQARRIREQCKAEQEDSTGTLILDSIAESTKDNKGVLPTIGDVISKVRAKATGAVLESIVKMTDQQLASKIQKNVPTDPTSWTDMLNACYQQQCKGLDYKLTSRIKQAATDDEGQSILRAAAAGR